MHYDEEYEYYNMMNQMVVINTEAVQGVLDRVTDDQLMGLFNFLSNMTNDISARLGIEMSDDDDMMFVLNKIQEMQDTLSMEEREVVKEIMKNVESLNKLVNLRKLFSMMFEYTVAPYEVKSSYLTSLIELTEKKAKIIENMNSDS